MRPMAKRECVVHSAQLWFDEARAAQKDGRHDDAMMLMINAFNHTENALVATLRVSDFVSKPPVSPNRQMSLTEFRAQLAALVATAAQERA